MMKHSKAIVGRHIDNGEGTFKSYVTGFVLSIIFTLTAYMLVTHRGNASNIMLLVVAIIGLALVQFVIQMLFFLHLGKETNPRWKLAAVIFMIVVVSILVFGSLWIIDTLNVRMTPAQENSYMNDQDGL